jgi:HSP20 family protein
MALIPFKPLFDLDKFFDDEDWVFPVFSRMDLRKPAMDLKETDKEIVAELEVPGFKPESIDVSIEEGVLKIKGTVDESKEDKKEGYLRREIRRESFERMVRLPSAVKEDEVSATYHNGVLTIIMPKLESKSSSKIKIQVKEK